MDKTTQPQQLSFSFEEPTTQPTVVSFATAQVASTQDLVADVKASPAVVYDFRSAMTKRKESTHASLYRQILDSVRHIG
jgi:hypothetical protein